MAAQGFFSLTSLPASEVRPRLPQCGKCGLLAGCRSPKMKAYGRGDRKVMVVGEAPGETEDARGRPFVGKAGQRLRKTFRRLGVDLDGDCLTVNALACRPKGNEIKDKRQIDYCRPLVTKAVETFQPEVLVLLGASACRSVLGRLWDDDPGGVATWAGWQIPCQLWNCWVCPTFHPSHVMRCEEDDRPDPVPPLLFERHLEAALSLSGPPFEEVPDYRRQVKAELSEEEVKSFLASLGGRTVAFDYENDRLKPDAEGAEIVCCAVSDGERTLAYPWTRRNASATRGLLLDPSVGKVASNLKHEHRWSKKVLGVRVRNWAWDTMQAAHALDCRPGITGLKFQAFVRLGQPDYSKQVSPFFKSEGGGNGANRIREVDITSLLMYNGLDALLEILVARHQADEMGVLL